MKKWMVLILSSCLLTACAGQNTEPVIAKKSTESAATADISQKKEQSIREQTQAPEHYQTSLSGENWKMEIDADVEVPEQTTVPIVALEQEVAYGEEEIQAWVEVMKELEGIDITADPFRFSSQAKSIIWVSRADITSGSNDKVKSDEITEEEFASCLTESREAVEARLDEKARAIFDRMGMADCVNVGREWRKISKHLTYGGIEWEGELGVRMHYVRSANNVAITPTRYIPFFEKDAEYPSLQYIDVTYTTKGELVEWKNIYQMHIGETLEVPDFWLPFDAVIQVLEQYAKSVESSDFPVTVTKIALEYQPSTKKNTRCLIPVWNFYGYVQGSERLTYLFCVDATS